MLKMIFSEPNKIWEGTKNWG